MTAKDRVIAACEALLKEARELAPEGSTSGDVKAGLVYWDTREEELEAAIEAYMRNASKAAPR